MKTIQFIYNPREFKSDDSLPREATFEIQVPEKVLKEIGFVSDDAQDLRNRRGLSPLCRAAIEYLAIWWLANSDAKIGTLVHGMSPDLDSIIAAAMEVCADRKRTADDMRAWVDSWRCRDKEAESLRASFAKAASFGYDIQVGTLGLVASELGRRIGAMSATVVDGAKTSPRPSPNARALDMMEAAKGNLDGWPRCLRFGEPEIVRVSGAPHLWPGNHFTAIAITVAVAGYDSHLMLFVAETAARERRRVAWRR